MTEGPTMTGGNRALTAMANRRVDGNFLREAGQVRENHFHTTRRDAASLPATAVFRKISATMPKLSAIGDSSAHLGT